MKAVKKTAAPYEIEKLLRHFCDGTSQELAHLLGAATGELEHGLKSGKGKPDDARKAMSAALKAIDRALHLARNLRYYAVQSRLNFQPRDISQLVLDGIDRVEPELKDRGIRTDIAVESNVMANVDVGAMEHVVSNLLWNASHAMPTGGKLTVALSSKDGRISLEIGDTGRGVGEESLDFIFDPLSNGQNFHQLGLAVVKAIIESHAGEIRARADKAKGTTFEIGLPTHLTLRQTAYLEKRRSRRVQVHLPCTLTTKQGTVQGLLTVLNQNGCLFHSSQPLNLAKDSIVSLRVRYLESEEIEIPKAKVANTMKNTSGIGIEFVELPEKAERILWALVKSHSAY